MTSTRLASDFYIVTDGGPLRASRRLSEDISRSPWRMPRVQAAGLHVSRSDTRDYYILNQTAQTAPQPLLTLDLMPTVLSHWHTSRTMSKDNRIVGYVTDPTMADVEALTTKRDISTSEFVSKAVNEQLERERLGELAEANTVESRLVGLVKDATDIAADQLATEAAPKIAEAVAEEIYRLDQQQQQQNTEQQQQQQQNQQTDDSIESGLID